VSDEILVKENFTRDAIGKEFSAGRESPAAAFVRIEESIALNIARPGGLPLASHLPLVRQRKLGFARGKCRGKENLPLRDQTIEFHMHEL